MRSRRPNYPKPITVQKLIDAPAEDSNGQVDLSNDANWDTQFAGNCRILTHGGREFVRASRQDATVQLALALRWCAATASIKPESMRVKFQSRTFQIVSAINTNEANREVLLACVEWVEG